MPQKAARLQQGCSRVSPQPCCRYRSKYQQDAKKAARAAWFLSTMHNTTEKLSNLRNLWSICLAVPFFMFIFASRIR
jgi:hypothetical protein